MIEFFKDEQKKDLLKRIEEALRRARRNEDAQKKYIQFLEIRHRNKKQQIVEGEKLKNIEQIIETLTEAKKWIETN